MAAKLQLCMFQRFGKSICDHTCQRNAITSKAAAVSAGAKRCRVAVQHLGAKAQRTMQGLKTFVVWFKGQCNATTLGVGKQTCRLLFGACNSPSSAWQKLSYFCFSHACSLFSGDEAVPVGFCIYATMLVSCSSCCTKLLADRPATMLVVEKTCLSWPQTAVQYLQAWDVHAKPGSCLRGNAAALIRSQKEELQTVQGTFAGALQA